MDEFDRAMLPQSMSGYGFATNLGNTAADPFLTKSIPYLGKKAVDMGRYYTSEMLRGPKLHQKAIEYALDKLNPAIYNVGTHALNQFSTKTRPKKKYKTNRKDLDGSGLDIEKQLVKLGELHLRPPTGKKYNYCGPGTKLEERLNGNNSSIRDPINKLDAIC